MAVTSTPIFPQAPYNAVADLSAVTACSTRGPTATAGLAAANIVALVGTSTNGRKIDKITVKASSTSITAPTASQLVGIWYHDGTKAYLLMEIQVDLVTPSTTSPAFEREVPVNIALPSTHSLYASTTITTTASTTALTVHAAGGDY